MIRNKNILEIKQEVALETRVGTLGSCEWLHDLLVKVSGLETDCPDSTSYFS